MKINIYNFYKEKYNLESLNLNITDSKILCLIYDMNFNYYLNNDKFIEIEDIFNILDIIQNFNHQYKLEIINFYPVCFCGSTLVLALKTNIVDCVKLSKRSKDDLNLKYQELINYHIREYSVLFVSSNVSKEINTSQKYINRYKFHERFIKKYILTEKKRRKQELRELISSLIGYKESIIDVACGDNSDILEIANEHNFKTIVGNDICINYLKRQMSDTVIFTNDDIELNRIAPNSYNISFCKNTLHHMSNLSNINNVLDFLNRISEEIIIVEIDNPLESKGLPKFLNKYLYNKFLKDVGSCYINEKQLKNIISKKFPNHKTEYYKFVNILGTYNIVKIRKEDNHEY